MRGAAIEPVKIINICKYFNPRAHAGRGVKANKNPLSALYNYNKKTPVFQQ